MRARCWAIQGLAPRGAVTSKRVALESLPKRQCEAGMVINLSTGGTASRISLP